MNQIEEINHRALVCAFEAFRSRQIGRVHDILLLSPSIVDTILLSKQFPTSRFFVATAKTWDLNQQFPSEAKMDLVVASNVFHYSPCPELWFDNVLSMTRTFIFQDLISRRRSAAPDGLCDDGDAVRYCCRLKGVESAFETPFDLSVLDDKIDRTGTVLVN